MRNRNFENHQASQKTEMWNRHWINEGEKNSKIN